MDTLSRPFRRSSAPELSIRLAKRPTLERKLSPPAIYETSSTSWCTRNHQFEKSVGGHLPDIIMTKQPRTAKTAWIGNKTQSCKDDGLVKLDIVVSQKQFCEGGNLSKGCIRKTKLSVNFQSRHKETAKVCTVRPLVSSSYQQKSKAIQQFIGNSEKNYDSHKEKAILLQNWIISQRNEWVKNWRKNPRPTD